MRNIVACGAWCWGSASKGVLGNGLTSGTFASPTQVLAGVPFKALDLSDTHSCAVDIDGQAWCWGDAERGKLGNGETTGTFPLPQPVDSDVEFTMIEARNDHACALGADGAA